MTYSCQEMKMSAIICLTDSPSWTQFSFDQVISYMYYAFNYT